MDKQKAYAGISMRAFIIGLTCAAAECLIAPYNDYVIRNIFLAGGHFPVGPFFVLIILVLVVNVILKRIHPRQALSSSELVTIWCIMIAAAGIPSSGMMRYALGPMVAYKYFATPENEWETLFHQYIPQWRVVRDNNAIRAFYEGLSAGEPIPWEAWLRPLAVWTLYVLSIYFVKLWFSIFLGWSLKFGIVKYGGLKAYRQARPLFLGLVLGEMTCAGIWAAVGMLTGVSTGYRILPD